MRIALVAPCAALALLAAFAPLYIGGIVVGAAMTRLAGNPAVNGADSDLSIALVGLAIGLLLATVSYVITRPWGLDRVPEAQLS